MQDKYVVGRVAFESKGTPKGVIWFGKEACTVDYDGFKELIVALNNEIEDLKKRVLILEEKE